MREMGRAKPKGKEERKEGGRWNKVKLKGGRGSRKRSFKR